VIHELLPVEGTDPSPGGRQVPAQDPGCACSGPQVISLGKRAENAPPTAKGTPISAYPLPRCMPIE
jgi:hypothetical protein